MLGPWRIAAGTPAVAIGLWEGAHVVIDIVNQAQRKCDYLSAVPSQGQKRSSSHCHLVSPAAHSARLTSMAPLNDASAPSSVSPIP